MKGVIQKQFLKLLADSLNILSASTQKMQFFCQRKVINEPALPIHRPSMATSMLQPAQQGGRKRCSPTWVSVTHSTLTTTMLQLRISDLLLNVVQAETHPLAWPGCAPHQTPPSHCPVPPRPFHIHQNQQYLLSEQKKPECFKFWSRRF